MRSVLNLFSQQNGRFRDDAGVGPACAFAKRLSLTLQRTNTKLLHETEQICIVPLFLNLAVRDAVE
jgi:hypothetical protein